MSFLQKAVDFVLGPIPEQKAVTNLGNLSTLESGRQDRDNFITNRISLPEHDDRNGGAGGVMGLATAWACVRLVAGTISSLPLMVYKQGSVGREVDYDHPLYRVLHYSPNSLQTALNFWQFMSASIELHGNAYAEVERAGNGRVIALASPFLPEFVVPKRISGGEIEYEITENGRKRTLPRVRMLHIRGFGGDPLGGLSTLTYGRQAFGMAQAIEKAAVSTFRNGIRSTGIFSSPADKRLTPEQFQQAQQIIDEKYIGAINAGRPMLLNGMSFQALSINPDDAQMLESRAFSVEEICRFFSVPPHMIGHTEKSTSWGTGIEQMTIGFVQFTLRERLKNIESTLEKQLLSEAERQAGMRIEFNIDGLLRGDSKTRAEVHASAIQNGWRTRNEVRALENLPPMEGGDVLMTQMQNVPITDTGRDRPPQADAA